MNNSDLIAALSLAITAIIFLIQTDDGLLLLKFRKQEKIGVATLLAVIILLINHQVFERFELSFYYRLGGFYLTPIEWALLLFLTLMFAILHRIFTPKIFNNNVITILHLIERYRREKKMDKTAESFTVSHGVARL